MRARPLPLLVSVAVGGPTVLVGGIVTALVWLSVPSTELTVMFQADVAAVVWPLAPVVLAAILPATLDRLGADLERRAGPRAVTVRALALAQIALVSLAVACLGATRFPAVVVVRNVAFLVGLALLLTAWFGSGLTWAPIVAYTAATWLLGTAIGGTVRPWAILLRHPTDSLPTALGAGTLALGVVSVLWRGARPPRN